jgi:peptidyl-prolyl cis-trans isomerase A (cyclophilin A)
MYGFIRSGLITIVMIVATLNAHAAETIRVQMDTSAGSMTLELYPEAAPLTVENFLRYVDGHYYDEGTFYRVVRPDNQAQNTVKIEVIQGGLNPGEEDPIFAAIEHESTQTTGIRHLDGTLSIARLEPGSATSEFFICINDQPELDFGGQRNPDGQGFAAFGKVTSGMEVARKIQSMATDQATTELEYTSGQILLEPVRIERVFRLESQN